MKALVFVGAHPRNLAMLAGLLTLPDIVVAGVVVARRGDLVPAPPDDLPRRLKTLWKLHFDRRAEAEERHFRADESLFDCAPNRLVNDAEELNNSDTVAFVRGIGADVCFITGVPIIRPPLLGALPENSVNLHLGLIPEYKGAITMFWPFYFLEPTMAGCTWHIIDKLVDTGEILHQTVPELGRGDGMHVVSCKASLAAIDDLDLVASELARRLAVDQRPDLDPRLGSRGKLFRASDWHPMQLRVIYELFDDRIVDLYLDGEIHPRLPDLKSLSRE